METIDNFVSKKVDDICNHLRIFYNYITVKREGFLTPISKNQKLDEQSVYKTINERMVNFIISSIYNCQNFKLKGNEYSIKITSQNIENKLENIEGNAIKQILDYVTYCSNSILQLSNDTFKNNYKEIINFVAENKREFENFDLENELSKMALQSIFHISLAFLDWLELDVLTQLELDCTIEFILTKQMYRRYLELYRQHENYLKNKLETEYDFKLKFERLCKDVYNLYKRYGIFVSQELCVKVSTHVLCLSNYKNLDKTFPKLIVKPLVKKMDKSNLLNENHEYFTKKINVLEPTLSSVQNILTNQSSPQSVFISEDKLKMHPPNVQDKTTRFDLKYHWGQRKLLLSEILFLTKVLDTKNEERIVVYVGSAKGTHIKILVEMFPNLKFELYDPNDYDDILYIIPNIKIYQQYFTDEDAKKYTNKDVIFISDIRTVPANMKQATEKNMYDFQSEVLKNQDMQKKWVEIINPYYSMLKFRCPYPEVGKPLLYKYIKGEVFKQVWAPVTSAETRLLIKQKDNYTLQDYDIIKHERQLAYFNLSRQYDFSNEKVDFLGNITLKDIWKDVAINIGVFNLDFYLELTVLKSYFTKFFKVESTLQTYQNNISYITSILNVNKQTKYPAIEFYFSK